MHSTLEPCEDADFKFSVKFNLMEHTVFVRCRPYLQDFLERVSGLFEIIIFTASQGVYADQLLNVLDRSEWLPSPKHFSGRGQGGYLFIRIIVESFSVKFLAKKSSGKSSP